MMRERVEPQFEVIAAVLMRREKGTQPEVITAVLMRREKGTQPEVITAVLMRRERVAPQSEVIRAMFWRAMFSEDSPCCGGCPAPAPSAALKFWLRPSAQLG